MCEEFKVFSTFLEYIGERPSKDHSIDRIDNSKGYEIGNVRWANTMTQVKNRSYYKNYKIYRFRPEKNKWYATYGYRQSRVSKTFSTEAEAAEWLKSLPDLS